MPGKNGKMKVDAQRKVVRKIDEDKAREEGREQGIKIGESIGEKRGEKRGKKEGKIETAKNMLKKGFEIDVIAELTGLKRKEIENIV